MVQVREGVVVWKRVITWAGKGGRVVGGVWRRVWEGYERQGGRGGGNGVQWKKAVVLAGKEGS